MRQPRKTIVVGAGVAGCVVASTLAAAGRQVTVIEAGAAQAHDPVPAVDLFEALNGRTRPDLLARRTSAQGLTPYLAGAGIGGGSLVNGMHMMAGRPADYSRWPGLGWSVLGPRFAALVAGRGPVPWYSPTDNGPNPLEQRLRPIMTAVGASERRAAFCATPTHRASLADLLTVCAVRFGTVESVLIHRGRTAGVRLASGEELEANEVILTSGAIETPRILLRSGCTLSGVGRRLRDHAAIVFPALVPPGESTPLLGSTRTWRWSSPGGLDDLALITHHDLVIVILMTCRSSGRIGADTVELNLLADSRDRAALAAGVRHIAPALGRPDLAADTDAELATWLMADEGGTYHASGTCRLGRASDMHAVVDIDGQVHGWPGAYVMDASVLPGSVRATPMATVVVVAAELAMRLAAQARRK